MDNEPIEGRVDVLVYKLLNLGIGMIERSQGLSGLQQSMKPFIEAGVRETINKKTKLSKELNLFTRALFGG